MPLPKVILNPKTLNSLTPQSPNPPPPRASKQEKRWSSKPKIYNIKIYTHTYIYIYIHTYIHTCIYIYSKIVEGARPPPPPPRPPSRTRPKPPRALRSCGLTWQLPRRARPPPAPAPRDLGDVGGEQSGCVGGVGGGGFRVGLLGVSARFLGLRKGWTCLHTA